MTASLRSFRTGLFEEHLAEASFLYDQCLHMRQAVGKPWQRVAAFEERLELHLDALVVGGTLALGVCQRRAQEGDAGEVFAAVSVFCRQEQASLLAGTLTALDGSDPDKTQAVADALKQELPPHWTRFIEQALSREDERLLPMLAATCGHRRIPCEAALCAALKRLPAPPLALVEAVGKLRANAAAGDLKRLLGHAQPALRAAALLALLRLGQTDALQAQYLPSHKESWPRLAMGLAGDASALHALAQPVASGDVDADSLHAIGLLGIPGSLRYLYECLADKKLAPAAARALSWVCGADLQEDAFTPEPVNEDELFPRELKAWREYKEAPRAADGKPFGSTERRLCLDPAVWKQWFAQHMPQFDPELRYRNGKLYSPGVLLDILIQPEGDTLLRRLAAQELDIRCGCPVVFEVDMPVAHQWKALRSMAAWVKDRERSVQPGRWA